MTRIVDWKTAAAALFLVLSLARTAPAEESWRASFDATCSKTDQAMTMSVQDLRDLLERCDALKKVIEAQEESVRKVYLKRLALCRNLYAYMLEYKQNDQGK